MDPYRAPGDSPTLVSLAAEGAHAIPRQRNLLTPAQIQERLELAADVGDVRASVGLVLGAIFLSMIAVVALTAAGKPNTAPLGPGDKAVIGLMFLASVGLIAAAVSSSNKARERRAAAVKEMLAWTSTLPFPADGWEEWLVCDQPLLDIVVNTAIERRVFVDAARAIDGAIDVEAINERTFRLVLPPRAKTYSGKHSSRTARFGDRKLLATLFTRLVLPLHEESGIQAIHFGGTIEERA